MNKQLHPTMTPSAEARELSQILGAMHEGGVSDLGELYTTDQADGDPFVARAAEVLSILADDAEMGSTLDHQARNWNGRLLEELEFAHRIIGALVASHLTPAQVKSAEAILAADPRAHNFGDGLVRYHERGDLIRKAGGNAELFRKPAEACAEMQDSRLWQRLDMAERALVRAGYTYHGGEEWKPPIGKAPPFETIDALRDMITRRATPLKLSESTTIATAIELLSKPRRPIVYAQTTGAIEALPAEDGNRRFYTITNTTPPTEPWPTGKGSSEN